MRIGPFEITRRKAAPFQTQQTGWWGAISGQAPKTVRNALESNVGWAFACIDAIASRAASIDYGLYVKRYEDGQEVLEPLDDHPFYDVWRNPNELFSSWQMRYLLYSHLCSAGCAYWYLWDGGPINPVSRKSLPTQVWPLEPHLVETDWKGGTLTYRYDGNQELDPSRLLVFRRPNIFSLYGSWSPLRAAGVTMDIMEFIDTYQRQMFSDGAWSPYMLTTSQELKEGVINQIKASWMRQFIDRRRQTPAILHSGLTVAPQPTNLDLDLVNLDKNSMEKVLGVFRTPKSKLGYSESLNKANSLEIDIQWNREVIQPLLIMVDTVIEQRWIPIYGNAGRLVGDFDSPVPNDNEETRANIALGLSNGFMTDNEARELLGMAPIDGGDNRYKPFNLMPVGDDGTVGSPFAAPVKPTGPADDEPEDESEDMMEEEDDDEDEVRGEEEAKAITRAVWTDARKDAVWKKFAADTEAEERRWMATLRKLFAEQEAAVLAELRRSMPKSLSQYAGWSRKKVAAAVAKDAGITQVVSVVFGTEDEFKKAGQELISSTVNAGGTDAMALLGVNIDFELLDPNVQRFIRSRSIKFAGMTSETTAQAIRDTLSEGVEAGETIDELAQRVKDQYAGWEQYRYQTIARTEVIGSYNKGKTEAYLDAGVAKKAWLSSRDPVVREDHLELDFKYREETAIGVTDFFEIGNARAQEPGGFGVPEQDCNCRCTTVPVLED